MQDSVYLGDLGGLPRHRQLVVLDLRGTGRSATPDDVLQPIGATALSMTSRRCESTSA